jgi:hypothetical protein
MDRKLSMLTDPSLTLPLARGGNYYTEIFFTSLVTTSLGHTSINAVTPSP